ncbi:MAG: preprotein translocase subunit SecG [Alphaproteobacteria bacterium]|nr:preprotein translocase subunit SecG [Alphaproteobacteria bacterium]
METVLLVIHVIISLALIGMVLIQRSESDGFGLGSGGGSNFMTGRAAANFLTRTTAILATLFILNSLALGIIAANRSSTSIVDTIEESADPDAAVSKKAEKSGEEKTKKTLSEENKKTSKEPSVPTGE